MKKDIGEIVTTITHESLKPDSTPVTSTSGFETICTYNWHSDGKAIIVPGGPRKWQNRSLPVFLTPDTGFSYIDQHAFHTPRYPFEPSFRALSVMNPDMRLDDVDIITNRNSLRKLLDFAGETRQQPFCIGLQMVKNTLFMNRKVKYARQKLEASDEGYGHSFEEAFTKAESGLDESSSHHRLVRYRLGGLDCVVRFEVDAYYSDSEQHSSVDTEQQSVDSITDSMAKVTINSPPPVSRKSRSDKRSRDVTATILRGTSIPVPPSQLAEIKTRKVIKMHQLLPQLWFGRTPYLLLGKLSNGRVQAIDTTYVEPSFSAWETTSQDKLQKLAGLLAELKRVTHGTKSRAAILLCEENNALQIFEATKDVDALPQEVVEKHWSKDENTLD